MKKSILLPLSLGLLMIGCSRTEPGSAKYSANDPSAANKPTADETAATATKDAADRLQVASASAPASTASAGTTIDAQKNLRDTSEAAVNSTLAALTESAAFTAPATAAAPAAEPITPESFQVAANSTSDRSAPAYKADNEARPAMAVRNTELNTPEPSQVAVDSAKATPDSTDRAKSEDRPALAARLTEWKLTASEIQSEFESSGRVMRTKPAGADQPTGPMDAILVALIKSELQGNADTSALKIDVAADKGVVTLKGSAQSLDQIGQIVAIALDTDGVTQATSMITLESAP